MSGLLFHLESNFFQEVTLRSLVYSAPFVGALVVGWLFLPVFWRVPEAYLKTDLALLGGLAVWGLMAKGAVSSKPESREALESAA